MIYLKSFTFPTEEQESPILDYVMTKWHNTVYPFKIASGVLLETLDFAPVTILYGSNGSGKTTLLNVMAQKLGGSVLRRSIRPRSLAITLAFALMRRGARAFRQAAGLSLAMMCLILC